VRKRERISEQNERFKAMKAQAMEDIHGVVALVAINVEDLADSNDIIGESLARHCGQPVSEAHPCPEGEDREAPQALTSAQKYKLAVMENRGKIIASIAGIVLAVLAVVFKTGGI
jgi:hypothetical protein